jgi:hypothetical protein
MEINCRQTQEQEQPGVEQINPQHLVTHYYVTDSMASLFAWKD